MSSGGGKLVGIDLGTQSLKAVVCDAELRVLGDHAVPIATQHLYPGWAEQDPASWCAACGIATTAPPAMSCATIASASSDSARSDDASRDWPARSACA